LQRSKLNFASFQKPKSNPTASESQESVATPNYPLTNQNSTFKLPEVADRLPHINYEAIREPVLEIQLLGYIPHQVEFFSKFIQRTSQQLSTNIVGPIPQPPSVRKWTVLTSPFKYKKFQETFERKSYKRLFKFYEMSTDGVDKLIYYLAQVCPAGLSMRVIRYEREEPGFGLKMENEMKMILENGGKIELPSHVYAPPMNQMEYIREQVKKMLLEDKRTGTQYKPEVNAQPKELKNQEPN
jgi:ribosomal protein S10